MEDNKAPPSVAPQGGSASRRPLGFCFWPHILYYGSHMFGCFSIFPMVFAEKIVFQGPFCPGPFSRLPNKKAFSPMKAKKAPRAVAPQGHAPFAPAPLGMLLLPRRMHPHPPTGQNRTEADGGQNYFHCFSMFFQ